MTDVHTNEHDQANGNGSKSQPLHRRLADALEATLGRLGKDSRPAYLKLVKQIESFPAKEREFVLSELRKLWDLAGCDGKNDATLQAARSFIDSTVVTR